MPFTVTYSIKAHIKAVKRLQDIRVSHGQVHLLLLCSAQIIQICWINTCLLFPSICGSRGSLGSSKLPSLPPGQKYLIFAGILAKRVKNYHITFLRYPKMNTHF